MTTWDILGNEIYLRNVASNYVNYVAVRRGRRLRNFRIFIYNLVYALDSRVPRESVTFNKSFMKWNEDSSVPWRAYTKCAKV